MSPGGPGHGYVCIKVGAALDGYVSPRRIGRDGERRDAEVYTPESGVRRLSGDDTVDGANPLAGFRLPPRDLYGELQRIRPARATRLSSRRRAGPRRTARARR